MHGTGNSAVGMRFTGTFIIVVVLFVAAPVTSNIVAVKPIQLLTLPFEFLGSSSVVLPASIIIFPISYIVWDVLTEIYGFRIARGVVWLGFGANLLVVVAQWITKILYETAATPLTYAGVTYMKRKEKMEVTDVPRSLNPLGIFA